MARTDFLETQLAQARAALEATERLKAAAEAQWVAALKQLKAIAAALLAPEWNELKREQPEAVNWPPEQLGAWIVEAGTRKLNRLELLAVGELGVTALESNVEALSQERDRWQEEALELRRQVERLATELAEARARIQTLEKEAWQLRDEASRLRLRVAELAIPTQVALLEPPQGEGARVLASTPEAQDSAWLAAWRASPDYAQDAEVLRVIGACGYALRESLARAVGMEYRGGSANRLFEHLREQGLIEERPGKADTPGRPPNLLRLTGRGRSAYRLLFGQEAVEAEDERLLRRHKSEEQVMLALQARLVLEEAGAEQIDLFPAPVGSAKFEIDLVAVLEGQRLYVELERASGRGQKRLDKWSRYAQVTKAFYFFVPNKEALNRLMTELNYWAFRRAQDAAGVVVHVCQLAGGKDGELWHLIRPLAGAR